MKIQVTFTIEDDERIVIGIDQAGEARPATRQEVTEFIDDAFRESLDPKYRAYREYTANLIETVKGTL